MKRQGRVRYGYVRFWGSVGIGSCGNTHRIFLGLWDGYGDRNSVSTAALLVRQSLSVQAFLYLADDCRLVSDSTRRSLRSADVSTYMVSRTLSSYGNRTFSAAASRL